MTTGRCFSAFPGGYGRAAAGAICQISISPGGKARPRPRLEPRPDAESWLARKCAGALFKDACFSSRLSRKAGCENGRDDYGVAPQSCCEPPGRSARSGGDQRLSAFRRGGAEWLQRGRRRLTQQPPSRAQADLAVPGALALLGEAQASEQEGTLCAGWRSDPATPRRFDQLSTTRPGPPARG